MFDRVDVTDGPHNTVGLLSSEVKTNSPPVIEPMPLETSVMAHVAGHDVI